MIKIILVLILLSIFIVLSVLLVKEAKQKLYDDDDNIIIKIVDFIIEEDMTFGILFILIVSICIIVFGL